MELSQGVLGAGFAGLESMSTAHFVVRYAVNRQLSTAPASRTVRQALKGGRLVDHQDRRALQRSWKRVKSCRTVVVCPTQMTWLTGSLLRL